MERGEASDMENENVRLAEPPALSILPPGFMRLAVLVSLLAAGMTFLAIAIGVKAWVMYLAWTAFGLGKEGIRGGLFAIATMTIGVLIGMLTLLGWEVLLPLTAAGALPIAVFVAVMLVFFLSLIPWLNNIPSFFLGLSTFFASQMPATAATFLDLAAGIVLGTVAAVLALAVGRFCGE